VSQASLCAARWVLNQQLRWRQPWRWRPRRSAGSCPGRRAGYL